MKLLKFSGIALLCLTLFGCAADSVTGENTFDHAMQKSGNVIYNSEVLGYVRDGEFVTTIDPTLLLADAKAYFNYANNSNVAYNYVEIKHTTADHSLNAFGLYAYSPDKTIVSAITVDAATGKVPPVSTQPMTLTCSGCTIGCDPMQWPSIITPGSLQWVCSPCEGATTPPCTKTTQVVVDWNPGN